MLRDALAALPAIALGQGEAVPAAFGLPPNTRLEVLALDFARRLAA
ncbi:MAG: hypothetical protein ACI8PZ_001280 [Myxococcota bacterium]|jgi:hypothetical protein